jgi:hypothetical protein
MQKRVRGVALVVVNPHNNLLVIQEKETKDWLGKKAGMDSIPMETAKPGEDDFKVLVRLQHEELPGLPLIQLPEYYVGAYRIAPHTWAKLYVARAPTFELPMFVSDQSDVGHPRWMDPSDAMQLWLRRGAWEMIQDYADGHRGVIRKTCINTTREIVRA